MPARGCGYDLRARRCVDLTDELLLVAEILGRGRGSWRNSGRSQRAQDEWWRTRDAGTFKLWKGKAQRLLLYPEKAKVYGYSVTEGSDGGYFFFRSRSCREEGKTVKSGMYKASEHKLVSRVVSSHADPARLSRRSRDFPRLSPLREVAKPCPRRRARTSASVRHCAPRVSGLRQERPKSRNGGKTCHGFRTQHTSFRTTCTESRPTLFRWFRPAPEPPARWRWL